MSKGTLVCAGITFEITDIRLRGSNVEVIGSANGPTPAFINEPVTIFGEDGYGVGQTADRFTFRPTTRHDVLTLTVSLLITSITHMAT